MKNIISERELKRMVKKVVREEKLNNINEDRTDFEMSGARSRKDYVSNPRERDISSMFGKYSEDVPPIVIRYLRKNPEAIVKRLYKIYGDKIFDYLPQQDTNNQTQQVGPPGPFGPDGPRPVNTELEETVDSEKDERYFIKNKKRKNTSHLPGFHKPALGEDELGEGYDSYMDDKTEKYLSGVLNHQDNEGEKKLSLSDVKSKMAELKKKDKDPKKKEVQGLDYGDLKSYLTPSNLVKTLRGF